PLQFIFFRLKFKKLTTMQPMQPMQPIQPLLAKSKKLYGFNSMVILLITSVTIMFVTLCLNERIAPDYTVNGTHMKLAISGIIIAFFSFLHFILCAGLHDLLKNGAQEHLAESHNIRSS